MGRARERPFFAGDPGVDYRNLRSFKERIGDLSEAKPLAGENEA
jgi:hypothetical protein